MTAKNHDRFGLRQRINKASNSPANDDLKAEISKLHFGNVYNFPNVVAHSRFNSGQNFNFTH